LFILNVRRQSFCPGAILHTLSVIFFLFLSVAMPSWLHQAEAAERICLKTESVKYGKNHERLRIKMIMSTCL